MRFSSVGRSWSNIIDAIAYAATFASSEQNTVPVVDATAYAATFASSDQMPAPVPPPDDAAIPAPVLWYF